MEKIVGVARFAAVRFTVGVVVGINCSGVAVTPRVGVAVGTARAVLVNSEYIVAAISVESRVTSGVDFAPQEVSRITPKKITTVRTIRRVLNIAPPPY